MLKSTLIALFVAGIVLVEAPLAGSAGSQSEVRTFSTGDKSELVKTVPIGRKRGGKERVVMRLPADRLGDVRSGDVLSSAAELEVTTCLDAPSGSPDSCVGKVYPFDPHVSAKVVLTDRADQTHGQVIGKARDLTCSQHHPNRNHHCVLVLPWREWEADRDLQGVSASLVVTAWHSNAKARNKLMIGAHSGSDRQIEQDKGRLSLVRFRPGDTPRVEPKRGKRVGRKLPIASEGGRPKDVLVRSLRLTNLHAGDEIYVDALSVVKIGSVPYNVLLTSELFTARSKRAPNGGRTGHYVAPDPEITEQNGFNCTQGRSAHRTPCRRPKVGVIRIVRDVDELYISVHVNARAFMNDRTEGSWDGDDRAKVTRAGYLRAYLYRQG